MNLTDGKSHVVSLYAVDWDGTSRSEKVEVLDAGSGAVLDTQTLSSFHNGTYLSWTLSGHVVFRFTPLAGANAVLGGIFFGNGASAPASATFRSADTTTQGTWKGVYGADGYNIIGDLASYPSYASVSPSGQSSYTWSASTADVRGLEKADAGATDRIAACCYNGSSFTVDVNLTDGKSHVVSLYAVDWDGTSRSEQVEVLDAGSGAVLDTQTLSSFHNGTYLSWTLSGHVVFRFTPLAGANAVLGGIFFGNGASAPASATFRSADTTTQGTWKGVYGADGYNIIGDLASYPSYASVSPSGQSSYTWSASTADVRGLEKADAGATDRIAACCYNGSSFTVDVNLTDGKSHVVSLYAVDWDGTSRSEKVEVLDAGSGAVLDTQTLSSFHNGTYLSWTLSGHVVFRFTPLAGANAVLGGIFFG